MPIYADPAKSAAYMAWRADAARWLPMAEAIAAAHGLPHDRVIAFSGGTNLVAALDARLVIKMFPALLRHQFVSERETLKHLRGKLSIAIPQIAAEGEHSGFSYIIMTRLSGSVGGDAWPLMGEAEKERALHDLGRLIAEVQRIEPGPLAELDPPWVPFLRHQLEHCRARHARLGLPQPLLEELDGFIAGSISVLPAGPLAILTGEYIQENLFFAQSENGWRLSGLFDFGDVMTGLAEYDLLGPSLFMAAGRAGRVRALFEGYGLAECAVTPEYRRRLMLLMLLHRFSNLPGTLAIENWPARANTLEGLEALIWPAH